MTEASEVESVINKISSELDEVKNHILSAKNDMSFNNYDSAISHLSQADGISTCSYCKQKINKFIADVNYIKSICIINYKSCEDTRNATLSEMQAFADKMPSIEEIRRKKVLSNSNNGNITNEFDIAKALQTTSDMCMKSFQEMSDSYTKMVNEYMKVFESMGSMFK